MSSRQEHRQHIVAGWLVSGYRAPLVDELEDEPVGAVQAILKPALSGGPAQRAPQRREN